MSKIVSTSKLSRAMKSLWKKSKDLFATKTELSGKSDKNHDHDSRYYTEAEINSKLTGKADSTHNHDTRYHRIDLPVISSGDINGYYTSNGTYNVSSSTTITGAPYTGAIYGKLTVFIRSTGDVIQHFTDCYSKEFVRHRSSSDNNWKAWVKVFSSAQKPTWDDIDGKPSTFQPATHNHDANYASKSHTHNYLPNGVTITKEGDDFFINY